MNRYLIVVDMQNDFIDGVLGSEEAKAILENVCQKIESFEGKIIFTQDTHDEDYLNSQEGKLLPLIHCIKNSEGWKLQEKLEEIRRAKKLPVYEKTQFASLALAKALVKENETQKIESIELIGICTDICVVSNALLLKAFLPETPILVDASCCAGVSPASHLHAIETMRSCQIGIKGA
ncbi:MAG: isochorismatase family cysteine hydrolase [Johnsonella sp.]|nr:isochorismatase family cysteine hydrolase [Johnsonella sp.]